MTAMPSPPRLHPRRVPEAVAVASLSMPTVAVSGVACADHGDHRELQRGDACRYQVAWSINPHMTIGAVEFPLAAAQHAAFVAALERMGVQILRLPFVHAAYDSVFVKDPALLLARRGHKLALLARPRHAERDRERAERARAYAAHGYEIVADDRAVTWEGGDVVMLPAGDGMFLGHGQRSRREAAAWLERHAGIPVWPLELCDPHLYHLDMALAILPDGTALVCPTALTPASLRVIDQVRGVRRVIRVTREIALGFGLNVVAVGDTIVFGGYHRSLDALVRGLGYQSQVVPLGQFHLAGGSAACLVSTVHRDPFAAT